LLWLCVVGGSGWLWFGCCGTRGCVVVVGVVTVRCLWLVAVHVVMLVAVHMCVCVCVCTTCVHDVHVCVSHPAVVHTSLRGAATSQRTCKAACIRIHPAPTPLGQRCGVRTAASPQQRRAEGGRNSGTHRRKQPLRTHEPADLQVASRHLHARSVNADAHARITRATTATGSGHVHHETAATATTNAIPMGFRHNLRERT